MKDFIGYNKLMENGLADKLFFLDHINMNEIEEFYDFGCANGYLISKIAPFFPQVKFVGYDINPRMLEVARQNNNLSNVNFISNPDKLLNKIDCAKKSAILFSSVLHEIPQDFYPTLLNMIVNFDYVIIRDMYFDKSKNENVCAEAILTNEKIKDRIKHDFIERYGKVDNLKNLYHLFLKYTYENNWDTEILEDYFSVDYDRILNRLTKCGYEIKYDEKYTLPFKKDEVKQNFNYDLKLPTHRKLISEKAIEL